MERPGEICRLCNKRCKTRKQLQVHTVKCAKRFEAKVSADSQNGASNSGLHVGDEETGPIHKETVVKNDQIHDKTAVKNGPNRHKSSVNNGHSHHKTTVKTDPNRHKSSVNNGHSHHKTTVKTGPDEHAQKIPKQNLQNRKKSNGTNCNTKRAKVAGVKSKEKKPAEKEKRANSSSEKLPLFEKPANPCQTNPSSDSSPLVVKSTHIGYKVTCDFCHLDLIRVRENELDNVRKEHACIHGSNYAKLNIIDSPSDRERITNKCVLCNSPDKVCFKDQSTLKEHYLVAHSNRFFSVKISNFSLPFTCRFCTDRDDCAVLNSWRDTLYHVGLGHEKLYQAMQHNKQNDLKNTLKQIFPDKFRRHARQRRKHSSGDSRASVGSKRSERSSTDNSLDNPVPGPSSRSGSMDSVARSSMRSRSPGARSDLSVSWTSMESGTSSRQATSGFMPPNSKVKTRRISTGSSTSSNSGTYFPSGRITMPDGMIVCMICPVSESGEHPFRFINDHYYRNHLAERHFSLEIDKRSPKARMVDPDSNDIFCGYEGCEQIFLNTMARIKHIGNDHGLVDKCLKDEKIFKKAKSFARQNLEEIKDYKLQNISDQLKLRKRAKERLMARKAGEENQLNKERRPPTPGPPSPPTSYHDSCEEENGDRNSESWDNNSESWFKSSESCDRNSESLNMSSDTDQLFTCPTCKAELPTKEVQRLHSCHIPHQISPSKKRTSGGSGAAGPPPKRSSLLASKNTPVKTAAKLNFDMTDDPVPEASSGPVLKNSIVLAPIDVDADSDDDDEPVVVDEEVGGDQEEDIYADVILDEDDDLQPRSDDLDHQSDYDANKEYYDQLPMLSAEELLED